jgi:uncharacterized membrane protein/protein-disulfide isomerase
MKPAARRLVVLFVLIGMAASGYALHVHYNLLTQPSYLAPCDVNATISCSQDYLSSYGSVFHVPVALYGLLWFVFVGLMMLASYRAPAEVRESMAGYLFAVSTIGLAVILYLAYAAFFILKSVCIFCLITYVAVIGIFLVSGIATPFPMTTLPRRAVRDLRALVRSPLSLVLSLVFLAGSVSALAFFPREVAPATAAAAAAKPAVSPQQAADQASDFERWFLSQPRTTLPVSNDGAVVLIVKFSDFICPACGQAYFVYRPVLAKYQVEMPGAVKLVTKNYPLDADCNTALVRSVHPGSCDAAAAYEMAKAQKREAEMEEFLFTNAPRLTPLLIRQAAATVGHVANWDAAYPAAMNAVKSDIALGRLLNIRFTPTFFINGVRIEGQLASPALFDQAIAMELKRAGKTP